MANGLLDRCGMLHSCEFGQHSKKAGLLEKKLGLKKSIEQLGWVKVYCAGYYFFEADSYEGQTRMKPTKRQLNWLFKNGFDISRHLE